MMDKNQCMRSGEPADPRLQRPPAYRFTDSLTCWPAGLLLLRPPKVKSLLMKSKPSSARSALSSRSATHSASPVTLAIDIGGTGLKAMLLDPKGTPIGERLRVPTPVPGKPATVLDALDGLQAQLPGYDRVSIGFPGVVKRGVTYIAVNL